MVLANPIHTAIYGVYIRFWPTLIILIIAIAPWVEGRSLAAGTAHMPDLPLSPGCARSGEPPIVAGL
jgi:hypothetical protein